MEPGDEIRFRWKDGRAAWWYGRVLGVNDDGSLRIVENTRGHGRAIHGKYVQRMTKGPRGGTTWVPVTKETN